MRIVIKGTVQGVGFRPAVYRTAVSLGLFGRVWNDGSDVIIDINNGEDFLKEFEKNIPPLANIESVEKIEYRLNDDIKDFSIIPSQKNSNGISIPTDTSICASCLSDIKSKGRRGNYAFTSCTDCGPRFTLLSGLPYDRDLTSMKQFPICQKCGMEFKDPKDRRFHHQTICCPECGPSYYLIDKEGKKIEGDPIVTFSRMLEKGRIGVAKSWGGMHICCTLDNICHMREWYRREQKPFAIMVKDIETVKKYGSPTKEEIEQLTSPHKPIVLIEKKESELTELISPGLNNIGIFLPYTGMQHILFDCLKNDALIMTSANIPGEPMILDDEAVMELGADMYLLHTQSILNRADDSVMKMFEDNTYFIRKSRGHIPSYLTTKYKGSAVAVGAQENLAGAIAKNGRIYPTQHIGNAEGIGVVEYLEKAIRFQMSLVDCRPQAIAMDLHPYYINRKFAKKLANEYDSQLIEVQHHWAHAASLIAENNLDDVVALTLDGTGHGNDGNAWGGEVLSADLTSYKRLAHLEYIPLLGSEKALYDLKRLKFAVDSMNGTENTEFNDRDAAVLNKLMNTSVKCSSMGRLLDTLSYTLGVCTHRTYDGEPAMKLETLLNNGKLIPGFETETINGVIKTANLFSRITPNMKPADVAYSVVYNVMKELTRNAIDYADSKGIDNIGITGGVSYNIPICKMFKELTSGSGHGYIFHNNVPNGDGGISTGQIAIALKMIE